MVSVLIAAAVDLVAAIARAKNKNQAADVVEAVEPLATGTISALQGFIQDKPAEAGITVEEFNAKIGRAQRSGLELGDEAQASNERIAAEEAAKAAAGPTD